MISLSSILLWGCEKSSETVNKHGKDIVVKLDEFITAYNENCTYKYSGSILVAKGSEILLDKGYGMANYEENVPNKPDTVFAIGSLTKSFTATAIMQLQEKKLLNVNDPISKYIDGNKRGDDITIHHLLTHTSGLKRDGLVLGSSEVPLKKNIDFINQANEAALMFEPGEGYSYSNAGYVILAAIIEKVSGKPYHDYIKDHILIPLKMTHSSLGMDDSYVQNQAVGYNILTDAPRKLTLTNFSCITGAGNIYSTVEDMYKYDRALYNEKLLSKESLDKMFATYSTGHYGYGWGVSERFGHREISHQGHIDGYYSSMIRFPDDDLVLIFLCNNADSTALYEVMGNMSAIVLGEDYIIPEKLNIVEVNSEVLNKCAGKYEFADGLSIIIEYEKGKLYQKLDDKRSYELLPISETEFYPRNLECARAKFIFDKNKNVVGLEAFSNGITYKGKKVDN